MPRRPEMFIGSSREGLDIARALQAELEDSIDSTIWYQGPFGLGGGSLDSLVEATTAFQYAALVLTPDDVVTKRGKSGNAPRDNVVFEVGFFIGSLGRERTFLVVCRDDDMELPSDLAGIVIAYYNARANLQAAIGPAAHKIRIVVEGVESVVAPSSPRTGSTPTASPSSSPGGNSSPSRLLRSIEVLIEAFQVENPAIAVGREHATMFDAVVMAAHKAATDDPLVTAISPLGVDPTVRRAYAVALEQLGILRSALRE